MKKDAQVIHWVDHVEEKAPESRSRRSYSDPTANEAIGNVMRESRKKKQRLREQQSEKQRVEEQGFERIFETGNRPKLKDVLAWFDDKTILHIGSRTAFYFIGTAKELKKDMSFVQSNVKSHMSTGGKKEKKTVRILNRNVIKVYSKLNPSEGVVIKTEGTESGDFWFRTEYHEAKKKYLADCGKRGSV